MTQVHEVSSLDELKAFASAKKQLVIDFYADWCGPCKKLKPYFQDLASKEAFKDIVFLKCNVDDADSLMYQYNITALPTVLVLRPSLEVDASIIGFNLEKITLALERASTTAINKDHYPSEKKEVRPVRTSIFEDGFTV